MEAGHVIDIDDPRVVKMQRALWDLKVKDGGSDSTEHLAGVVYATEKDLRDNGINDETALQVCQHLTQSIPANVHPDITSVAAGYLVLREAPTHPKRRHR
jgi:hypothetical protein